MPKKGYKQTETHKRKHIEKITGSRNGRYSGKYPVDIKNPLYRKMVFEDYKKNNLEKLQAYWKANKARRTSGDFVGQDWIDIKKKFNYQCLSCKKREPEISLTLDHIVPLMRGGLNTKSNIQPLCGKCNRSKFTKTIDYRYEVRET